MTGGEIPGRCAPRNDRRKGFFDKLRKTFVAWQRLIGQIGALSAGLAQNSEKLGGRASRGEQGPNGSRILRLETHPGVGRGPGNER